MRGVAGEADRAALGVGFGVDSARVRADGGLVAVVLLRVRAAGDLVGLGVRFRAAGDLVGFLVPVTLVRGRAGAGFAADLTGPGSAETGLAWVVAGAEGAAFAGVAAAPGRTAGVGVLAVASLLVRDGSAGEMVGVASAFFVDESVRELVGAASVFAGEEEAGEDGRVELVAMR